MSTLKNTKPQSLEIDSISDAMRCHYRRPSGRRCKLAVPAPGAPFCFSHTQEFNKADSLNLKTALLTDHQGFQTAQGINNSLGNLYILLANNYISPRRAAVLAYINSLQLRTLPVIDADQAAGITDPTADQDDETNAELEPETEIEPEPEIEIEIEPASRTIDPATTPADSSASPCPAPNSTSAIPATPPGWLTELDPTKKPS